jgi:hypothetical protein
MLEHMLVEVKLIKMIFYYPFCSIPSHMKKIELEIVKQFNKINARPATLSFTGAVRD